MKFSLQINMKMPTFHEIFTANKYENATIHEIFSANKYENANNSWHFPYLCAKKISYSATLARMKLAIVSNLVYIPWA